ncbi:MAG: Crp/Fnr family transcriptional regulator [Peptococcaceae bacterium]|nr:Crp/Fnr family transcriptional regulator [Peptococcaceae bacterium]MBO5428680.1 Crp/Fnr family transcriptional regulator [Peptococcaceae bacterium]
MNSSYFVNEITLLKNYPEVTFQKKENILLQGSKANYVYYLSSGICTRNIITEKGDEIVYDMRSADDTVFCLLGALALYLPVPLHETNFTAKTFCVCHKIPAQDFINFLSQHPSIMHELLKLALHRYNFLDKNFQSKQKQSTANRVCSFLAENLYEQNKRYYVKEHLTNTEISRYLGVHRVTIVKIMQALIAEEIVEKTSRGLLIKDIDSLLVYARDEDILKYS